MSNKLKKLQDRLSERFGDAIVADKLEFGELSITVTPARYREICFALRDEFSFQMLIDLTVVDYLAWGQSEWDTDTSDAGGFSRGVEAVTAARLRFGDATETPRMDGPRFCVVVHLLSLSDNRRLRLKCYCEDNDMPSLPSVTAVWNSANWYEREAFDLFGVIFREHPDLRRILTDYGFVGHPFRKDFPLIGNVEMRYDPEQRRVIYEPVSIEPRVLTPRMIRGEEENNDA